VDNAVMSCHNQTPDSPDHLKGRSCFWQNLCDFACGLACHWVLNKYGQYIKQCSCNWVCGRKWICNCFPEFSQVITPNGLLTMSQIQIGENVLTQNSLGNQFYTPVIGFLHYEPSVVLSNYIRIETNSGHALTISVNHLLFTTSHTEGVRASAVQIGDKVWIQNNSLAEVKSTGFVRARGAYAPLTAEGTLFVDGILTSSYAYDDAVIGHRVCHAVFAPFRWYYGVKKAIWPNHHVPVNETWYDKHGIMWYASALHQMYSFVQP